VQARRVAPRVAAEEGHGAAGRPGVLAKQAEQDADRGGLARAVRPQEGVYLAGADSEVQAVQCRVGDFAGPKVFRSPIPSIAFGGACPDACLTAAAMLLSPWFSQYSCYVQIQNILNSE